MMRSIAYAMNFILDCIKEYNVFLDYDRNLLLVNATRISFMALCLLESACSRLTFAKIIVKNERDRT